MSECPFCDPKKEEILFSNEYCYARFDGYPVSPGHILVIPFRHYADYFESSSMELDAFRQMILQCKCFLDATHHPDGYNVGGEYRSGSRAVGLSCTHPCDSQIRGRYGEPERWSTGSYSGK